MEPIEWGFVAIAAIMGKKALETASETLTKETLHGTFSAIKSVSGQLSDVVQRQVIQLGSRVQGRFPEQNPFDNPELVAAMAEEEVESLKPLRLVDFKEIEDSIAQNVRESQSINTYNERVGQVFNAPIYNQTNNLNF